MPSTTSSSVSRPLASSTVMTPSLPTLAMALAVMSPTSLSPLAEIVPTWPISSFDLTFLERFLSSATTASTAFSMPRFRSIGFMPAATDLLPSRTMARASTVAVVVPSPAMSLVLLATSRSICAPMFSNLSESSISLATVTPSLVMRGAPNDLSRTTLRPLGPSVTRTACARMSTPRNIRSRASVSNLTSFAAMSRVSSSGLALRCHTLDHAENVAFLHDDAIVAIDLDLGAGPLAEQNPVADLDVEGMKNAVLAAGAGPGRDHFAFHRLFLGGVGNDDPALGLLFLIQPADQNAVLQRLEVHWQTSVPLIEAARGGALSALTPDECQGHRRARAASQGKAGSNLRGRLLNT